VCGGDSFRAGWFVWPSLDHVLISLRLYVDFIWSTQAKIMCRFHWDRVSISPGVIGVRLRIGKPSL